MQHGLSRVTVVAVATLTLSALAACSARKTGSAPSTTVPQANGQPSTPTATQPPAATAVPAKYRALYASLSEGLDAYQHAIDALPAVKAAAPTTGAAELLPANGNRLTQLFAPATLLAVDSWLDRFHSLGLRGVTIGIKVPMLLPQFGRDGDRYTNFFSTVVQHAHARDMTVDVELGELFCGTAYAQCSYSFHGSYNDFVDATVAQAKVVIDRIHPDNLTVLAEPTTEATLTGVSEFNTPTGTARYVHDVVTGISDRAGVKVGAGAAAWLPRAYNQAILEQRIDYLVIHVYPVNANLAANLVEDTRLASNAGVPIVADEVGLYKTNDLSGAGPATAETIFRLDAFSFFEPLDVRFAEITAQWARKSGVAYASVFWSGQFFSYVDWTATLDTAPFPQLSATLNTAVRTAFAAEKTTEYGRTWTGAFKAR